MIGYVKEIVTGTVSLLTGMAITIKFFFKPVVTVQYPHEDIPMTPRFRGHIELIPDAKTGSSKCIVCMMCQKACPSGCISLTGAKPEGAKRKVLTKYTLDFTRCSLCGLCVDSCKPSAIAFSNNYNLAGTSKEHYIFDLKTRMEEGNR